MDELLQTLGQEITDPEEESFLLFSQSIPSHNLGFVDAQADDLQLSVAGMDVSIHQPLGILSSNRKTGTTGAAVWKVTPLIANWLSDPTNVLFALALIDKQSVCLELGCGVSGLVALALGAKIGAYYATDQDYILKAARLNIASNYKRAMPPKVTRSNRRNTTSLAAADSKAIGNIHVRALDWETSDPANLYKELGLSGGSARISLVIACDCIYNEHLIDPFVTVCADICKLAPSTTPTSVLVAQQLRSPEVFESWLRAFCKPFRVWRLPDAALSQPLRENSGFVVHLGILRDHL